MQVINSFDPSISEQLYCFISLVPTVLLLVCIFKNELYDSVFLSIVSQTFRAKATYMVYLHSSLFLSFFLSPVVYLLCLPPCFFLIRIGLAPSVSGIYASLVWWLKNLPTLLNKIVSVHFENTLAFFLEKHFIFRLNNLSETMKVWKQ